MRGPGKFLLGTLGLGVALAITAGLVVLWSTYNKAPLPISDRCTADVAGRSATLDPAQARNAAVIAGVSIRRNLVPRAASIALATAYQESGVRNLDYGHADSLGLFQQRPSKGWGSEEQIMDPWYSSAAFYAALVRVKGWRTKDINDVAQAVQRSAYPEAYRRHVVNARTLASSLTGETPASFTCVVRSPEDGDAAGMRRFLDKTLGRKISIAEGEGALTVTTKDPAVAWAVAHQAIANTGRYGLESVTVGGYSWASSRFQMASWQGTGPTDGTKVVLTFSDASPR